MQSFLLFYYFYSLFFLSHTCTSCKNPNSVHLLQSASSWGRQQLRQRGAESEPTAAGDVENTLHAQWQSWCCFRCFRSGITPAEFFISMLQTPSASSKKSAPKTPVKKVAAASPNKRKLVGPVAAVPAAPGESSETTDISENEGNLPAVVRFLYFSRICFSSLHDMFRNIESIIRGDVYAAVIYFVWLFSCPQTLISKVTQPFLGPNSEEERQQHLWAGSCSCCTTSSCNGTSCRYVWPSSPTVTEEERNISLVVQLNACLTHSMHFFVSSHTKEKEGKTCKKSRYTKKEGQFLFCFYFLTQHLSCWSKSWSWLLTVLLILSPYQRKGKRLKVNLQKMATSRRRNQKPKQKTILWLLEEMIQSLTAVWM